MIALLWVYLAGYAWFWRYHVGAMLDTSYEPDGADFAFALFFGTMGCLIWPLTAAGRGVQVLWLKYMSDDTSILSNFFPAPKEIETRAEKRERLARQQRDEIRARRREINDHERTNGLELTRWTE